MKRTIALGTIAVCMMLAQPARAQSNLGFQRGGVSISMVSPENVDATLGLGVFADLGTLAPNWGLETRLDWWSHSETFFNTDIGVTDITLGARTKYHFPSTSTVQPFVGAGLGLHFISMEMGMVDPISGFAMTADASETRLGMDLGGGITTPLNPSTRLHAEGWFGLVSDFNQFSLRLGLSRSFGN